MINEFMLDDNLISTLETSLRQTRNAQNRLSARLQEVESEAKRLRKEIEALDNSASQTEAAIFSLLETMRSGNQSWNFSKEPHLDDEYEIPSDVQHPKRSVANNHGAPSPYNYRPPHNPYLNNSRSVPIISSHTEPMSHRFSDRTITQACTLLLREAGEPMHVNELYNMLVAGGMEFTGNNPTISIAVSLNRNRRFRKVAPGTFDLVMRDASQAAY
jgi:hypothetical protein